MTRIALLALTALVLAPTAAFANSTCEGVEVDEAGEPRVDVGPSFDALDALAEQELLPLGDPREIYKEATDRVLQYEGTAVWLHVEDFYKAAKELGAGREAMEEVAQWVAEVGEAMRGEQRELRAEQKAIRAELAPLREDRRAVAGKLKEVRAELKLLRAKRDDLRAEIEASGPQAGGVDLLALLDDLKATIAHLKADRDSLRAERDDLRSAIDALRADRDDVRADKLMYRAGAEVFEALSCVLDEDLAADE